MELNHQFYCLTEAQTHTQNVTLNKKVPIVRKEKVSSSK